MNKWMNEWMESYLCVLSSRFWAAHVLELFLVPAESILEASWLGQNWFAHQILVSLLVTWSTAAHLRCPGVFLITLPNLWLPSWLPHAIFLVSTHLPGLWFVWHLTPTWILQLTWLRHSLAVNPWHLCFPFLTKLPYLCLCLSPWPTSELTSSPTPSALPHFSQGLPLPCHMTHSVRSTRHWSLFNALSVFLWPWDYLFLQLYYKGWFKTGAISAPSASSFVPRA